MLAEAQAYIEPSWRKVLQKKVYNVILLLMESFPTSSVWPSFLFLKKAL